MRSLALPTLLLLALASASAGDEKIPSFTGAAEVTLVEVPVHVNGTDGLPIRGLSKEDFELLDDGKRVEIRNLEVVDLEDFTKDVTTPRDLPLPPAARRHFFFLFDLSFSTPVHIARARSAARDFVLDGMRNGDLGAVATFDVERGTKLVLSFTPDRDQIAEAVRTLGLPTLTKPTGDPLALTVFTRALTGTTAGASSGEREKAGDVEIADILDSITKASQRSFDAYQRGRVTQMIQSFSDLARSLNSVRGRKNILFFSEGFDSRLLSGAEPVDGGRSDNDWVTRGQIWRVDNENRFGNTVIKNRFDTMFQLFNRSDCVIQAIDVAGLRTKGADAQAVSTTDITPDASKGSRGRGEDALYALAHETGGDVFRNSNDLPGQLGKLEQRTSLVYLLVFQPRALNDPGRYHDLKVRVRAPGAHVSARAGYYEPLPFSKLSAIERRLLTAQLIAYGLPRSEVPARVLAAPFQLPGDGRAAVPVIVEVPGQKLLKDQSGEKMNVELYAYATDAKLRVVDFISQQVSFDLGKLRKQLEGGGIKYYGTLLLPPGTYWLKVLVRNNDTGRTGLQIVPLAVPDTSRPDLFVLPPFFTEPPGGWVMVKGPSRNAPGAGDYPFVFDGDSFIPAAGPSLPRDKKATLCLIAYDPIGKTPLTVEGRIRGTDGQDYGIGILTLVKNGAPEGKGIKRMMCSFDPASLSPGAYSLVVTVKNPENGQEGQSAGAFFVR